MIRDALLTFSDVQAIAAGASTNVVDFGPLGGGNTGRQIGAGVPLYLAITFPTALVGDLAVAIQTSDSDSSGWATVSTTTIPAAQGVAGSKHAIPLPPKGLKRFVRLNYSGGTGGTIWAGIVQDVGDNTLYAGGYTMAPITYPDGSPVVDPTP